MSYRMSRPNTVALTFKDGTKMSGKATWKQDQEHKIDSWALKYVRDNPNDVVMIAWRNGSMTEYKGVNYIAKFDDQDPN